MADIPPNQTIYVNNLPEKIKKHGASRAGAGRRAPARWGSWRGMEGRTRDTQAYCPRSAACAALQMPCRRRRRPPPPARLSALEHPCATTPGRCCPPSPCRAEAAAVCAVRPVWQDHRRRDHAHRPAARAGAPAACCCSTCGIACLHATGWLVCGDAQDGHPALPNTACKPGTLATPSCCPGYCARCLRRRGSCLRTLQQPPTRCAACRASPSMKSRW